MGPNVRIPQAIIEKSAAMQRHTSPLIEIKVANPFKCCFKKGLIYLALMIGAVSMLAPFLWMVSTSLKSPDQVLAFDKVFWKEWIPTSFVWQNYVTVWKMKTVPFAMFYLNSIFVSVCITFGQVATSSMAAYAFARLHFPGRDKLFFGYLATMMIPGAVTMIPVFILLRHLGWVDTYKALILPGIFTAYGTFMLRQFFLTLPKDLEDAAKIDGCSYLRIFWHIILPLSKPAIATLTTFTFMGSWMNLMWPLIVVNTHSKYTLPVGLAYFQGVHGTDWTLLMAGSVMMILPILVVFLFNQRFFVEGIKLSGIKG
ncbi:MAG: L-arabinose transport system permease protein AraQ [Candidatus Omnitrophica bacterium ADurb.Bin292]|jgi:multiple sugar transport system permease protein|nr:MAG: L-arabinose transport system permease protein AraQ [Candidatus Omnitrophica bacterium ADurb.Bin292]